MEGVARVRAEVRKLRLERVALGRPQRIQRVRFAGGRDRLSVARRRGVKVPVRACPAHEDSPQRRQAWPPFPFRSGMQRVRDQGSQHRSSPPASLGPCGRRLLWPPLARAPHREVKLASGGVTQKGIKGPRQPESTAPGVMGGQRGRLGTSSAMARECSIERGEGDSIVATVPASDRHRASESIEHASLQAPMTDGADRPRARRSELAGGHPPSRHGVGTALSRVSDTIGHSLPLPDGFRA